jgi:hypothetical protein
MSVPVDKELYETIKKKVWKQYEKPSAYRSGALTKEYKKQFKKKYGDKSPYKGSNDRGLDEWFEEDWKNQRGEVGYKYKSDVYRPTKRVDKFTPMTFAELGKDKIKKARRKKSMYGRVRKFS